MSDTLLEEKKANTPYKQQLSNKALLEMVRAHVPKAIQTLVDLLDSPTDNARVGAAKIILAKVLPDLKSEELTGDIALTLRNIIRVPTKELITHPSENITDAQETKKEELATEEKKP